MHQHTQAEAATLASDHYGIEVRTVISLIDEGINDNALVRLTSPAWPASGGFTTRKGVMGLKLLASSILGDEPFRSATITADLDQPITEAEIRLSMFSSLAGNLSPYISGGPTWDFDGFFGGPTGVVYRSLFDAGVYIQLQGRYVSQIPRFVTPNPPSFVGRGTLVQTAGDGIAVTPAWPSGHTTGDIAFLFVVTANEVATVSVPAGFVEIPGSPQGTGTAGAAGSVRLAIYWCRATSNAMAKPSIVNPGNHVIARILAWRGCKSTGNPWDVTPQGSVAASASTSVTTPTITLTSPRNRFIAVVAGATDTLTDQTDNWTYLVPNGGGTMDGRTDSWRDIGNGGGFGVADALKQEGGETGNIHATATLATATAQAQYSIALATDPVRSVVDDPLTVPWRPFFTGRIDSVDPVAGEDELVLRCRDIYSDTLDGWMVPPLGKNGFTMSSDEGTDIGDLLASLFVIGRVQTLGSVFAVDGNPDMIVPTYFQEAMSPLLAMRVAGLQNGWDLRPRFGTAPYGQDQLVLTYYDPDRALAGLITDLGPNRYFGLSSMGKSRDEVRNQWRVTPGARAETDPLIVPRLTIEVIDAESQVRYGFRYAAISEDASSLVSTDAQAVILANALLSDTKEPKIMAEVERRFYPYVEINDVYRLKANNVQHDTDIVVSVTGYTHTLTAGDGTTVMRTRSRPAAASLEWRQLTVPKTIFISDEAPTGSAVQGARWHKVRS